jgi:ubiquinone/menaquinone biosynthesis C-methylase UbiE
MFNIGSMSQNDIRDKEDMDPIDDPLADEYFVPMNMIPLSMVQEYLLKNTDKAVSEPKPTGAGGNQNKTAKNSKSKIDIVNRKKDNVDWKKVYKEGKAHWADDMQPSKFAQGFAQKLIDQGKKSILEIGCGNGRDSILFALAGLNVTAIDLVPEAIEIAKDNAKNAGVEIEFKVGTAESLEFSDASFDSVFTLSVLHSTDMAKSIPEVYRVLKNKGLSLIYIYSNVEKIDGSEKEFISIDEYIDLIKEKGFNLADLYTLPEEEFDEAGEKHLIIVSEVQK